MAATTEAVTVRVPTDFTGYEVKLFDRVACIRPHSVFGRRILVQGTVLGWSAKMIKVELELKDGLKECLVYPDQLVVVQDADDGK